MDPSNAKPLEVVELDAVTIAHRGSKALYSFPAITVLSNGDPLISFPVDEPTNLVLMRFDAANGDLTQAGAHLSTPPPPHCAKQWAPVRFLKEGSQKIVWLFGSPWQGVGANACGWIGEAVVPNPK
jgi:hypothetical protein